jgi:anti-anti-sigma factor
MSLKLTHINTPLDEGLCHVAVAGDITTHDFQPSPRNPVAELLGPGWPSLNLVLDFDQVLTIDSSAVGWLISCHKECRRAGGQLVIHSVQKAVRQILDILRIDKLIPIAADAAEARTIVSQPR